MSKEEIIQDFFQNFEKRDYDHLMELFAKNAKILSPVLGEDPAELFYKKIFADIKDINVNLIDVFDCSTHPNRAVAQAEISITLNNDDMIQAEVMDLFDFEEKSNKIQSIKIIYDSQEAKEKIEKLRKAV